VRNVPLAVYDQSHSTESRALLDAYRAADYFKVAFAVNSETEMRQIVESGQAKAGLIIPPDYARQLKEGTAQVAFVLDGSDPTVASTSLSAAQLIGQKHATDVLSEKLARSGQGLAMRLPVEIRTTVWFNPDLASAYFMIPGVIGMVLSALTAMLTATAVVRERERGTIEQLIVTPIRSWELIVGKLVPYTILSLFNMLEVLALGHWWFGVPIIPDFWAGHWPVCLHDCQHPAGSHADRLDDLAAKHFSLRFLLPDQRHASCFAGHFLCHSTALLPGAHSRLDDQRRRSGCAVE
jgi:ABC-2 type transport system permease protein